MDPVRVEHVLRQDQLACPRCARPLAGWWHAWPRRIRGRFGAGLMLRPRRTRCPACATTHVLLPEAVLPRRADAAEVVGAGLEMAATCRVTDGGRGGGGCCGGGGGPALMEPGGTVDLAFRMPVQPRRPAGTSGRPQVAGTGSEGAGNSFADRQRGRPGSAA
ncbi:DUF6431 domain-containing protein [Streptomyces sp. NPDC059718]